MVRCLILVFWWKLGCVTFVVGFCYACGFCLWFSLVLRVGLLCGSCSGFVGLVGRRSFLDLFCAVNGLFADALFGSGVFVS